MKEKKHFHLMSGSTTDHSPEQADFYLSGDAAKKRFEELKNQYITAHDTPEQKLFFSMDEYNDPQYCKVCQFGHIQGMKEIQAPTRSDVDSIVQGDWQPTFMIMLVECLEDECMNTLN